MEYFAQHPILVIFAVIVVLTGLRLVGIGKGLVTWIGAGVVIILSVLAARIMMG